MRARTFVKGWAIALLALVLLGLLFPLILTTLVWMSGCSGVGGACGAVATVIGIYGRALPVLCVGIYITSIAWRRSRTLGLTPWGPLLVLRSFLHSGVFFISVNNLWAANFAMGIVALTLLSAISPLAALRMRLVRTWWVRHLGSHATPVRARMIRTRLQTCYR